MKLFFKQNLYLSRPSRACFREGHNHLSLSGHNPTRGRRRKLFLSFYTYHGPRPCLLASGLQSTFFSLSDHMPISLGGGENFPSYISSRSKPCLLSRGLWPSITVQSQPTFGGGEEVIFCLFLFLPPYNQCLPVDKRVL